MIIMITSYDAAHNPHFYFEIYYYLVYLYFFIRIRIALYDMPVDFASARRYTYSSIRIVSDRMFAVKSRASARM